VNERGRKDRKWQGVREENGRSVEGTIRTKRDKGVYRQEFKGMRDQSKGIHCTFCILS
jgi:hypothetical protein